MSIKPPFKWVGGKRQLLPELMKRLPESYNTYLEPFIGGGALFFHLAPKKAFISDVNGELINAYLQIRNNVDELIGELKTYVNTEEFYYEVRGADRQIFEFLKWSDLKRAARFIYLNKTCFNGLYRVNSSGFFNVPFGKYENPKILDEENLQACSRALSGFDIYVEECDYKKTIIKAHSGDFVYLDPPYVPLNVTSSFTMYSKDGFTLKDQEVLRDICVAMNEQGVKWMQSNSSAPIVYELYKDFNIEEVEAKRNVSASTTGRAPVKEVIIRNY